jgi:hypothetical protein
VILQKRNERRTWSTAAYHGGAAGEAVGDEALVGGAAGGGDESLVGGGLPFRWCSLVNGGRYKRLGADGEFFFSMCFLASEGCGSRS